jgi:spore maturation protein CgeB
MNDLDVVFLNDSPVACQLASGFRRLGYQVAHMAGENACGGAPHLWDLEPQAQIAAVEGWLARNGAPSLVVFEGFTGARPIDSAATEVWRRAGARFVYWAIEDPLWTTDVVDGRGRRGPYASVADHIATTAAECVGRYETAGIASSVMQFACDPDVHKPVPPAAEHRSDVVLVANDYPRRRAWLIERLLEPAASVCARRGATLAIYGYGWDTDVPDWIRDAWRGPLRYEELPTVYASTAIALGAEQCLDESETQCSMRVFEVLGCGACYVGPDHRAHRALFRPGEHLFLTSSAAETAGVIERLLNSPEERSTVAAAGRRVCLADHTYDVRVTELLRELLVSHS